MRLRKNRMSHRKLLVTHHAPDLDAVGAVWLFKRFDAQHFAEAKVAFVDQGTTITLEEAEQFGSQLHEVVHVDTGLGAFDHHQPDKGQQRICASSLVHDHVCQIHPDLKSDKALATIVEFITSIDHFEEVFWQDAADSKYQFMIHELLRGIEFTEPHDDNSQLHFGMQCLDAAYGNLTQYNRAAEIIASEGKHFITAAGPCLAVETKNDDVIKLAQKQGMMIVVRKDPELGHIRIKARPDAKLDFRPLADKIASVDTVGSWFYHPSGKMLLNGSQKKRNQKASPLTLNQVISLILEVYP